jgi:hypothetical protein
LTSASPRSSSRFFAGHECSTVPEAGLAGRKNGELLAFAEERSFDVLVSLDKGLQYQQNLAGATLQFF